MGCGCSTQTVEEGSSGEIIIQSSIHEVEVNGEGNDATKAGGKPQRTMSIKVEHITRRESFGSKPSQSPEAEVKFQPHDDGPLRGKYQLGKKLGRGKFGHVHAALDLDTDQQVAVKVMCSFDKSVRPLALKEIEIMKALDHPRCVRLLDAWEGETDFYMVQELAGGGELFEYIVSKGHLLEEEAAKIARQILEGLEYMHTHNVCHRDLKPQNLLLERAGSSSIKIADFGLSSLHGEAQRDGDCMLTICGTPDFLAPEVVSLSLFKSTGGYSDKVDVWAAGAILYTMLSGSPPFANPNVVQTLMAIREGKVDYSGEVWQAVSEEARTFTSFLLQADPALRPSATQCLAHAWLSARAQYLTDPLAVSRLHTYCLRRRANQVRRLASIVRIMGGRGAVAAKLAEEERARAKAKEERLGVRGREEGPASKLKERKPEDTFSRSSSLAEVIGQSDDETEDRISRAETC